MPLSGADDLPPDLLARLVATTRSQVDTLARLAADAPAHSALDAVRREAHKIRGSAGAIGYPEATAIAGALEDTVARWLAGSAIPADAADVIARAVAELRAALPAGAAPEPDPAAAPSPRENLPEVIVVEDDPALGELLAFGLESKGYRFSWYRNGREALEQLLALETGGTQPLLLLDVDLPGLDGYAFVETLNARRPGVFRPVFLTVHGSEEEQVRGLQAGAVDYLVKPVMLRVLLEKVRRWLGR